ncbi:MAG: transglycosylase SLT domain-containing protein [Methylococcales bacterium]
MKYTIKWYQIFHIGFALMLLGASTVAYTIPLNQQRQLFLDAKSAIAKGQMDRLQEILPQLEDYPLLPYLRYKSLLGKKNQFKKVELYLKKYPDTPYASSLRNNQLALLASQKRWNEYASLYATTSNTKLQCHYQWAMHKTGNTESALKGAKQLWLTGHSQPPQCDALFQLLKQKKKLSNELIWQRFGLALHAGNPSFARYLKKSLPTKLANTANFWLKVYRSPQTSLLNWRSWPGNSELYSEIFVQGLERLVSKNLNLANKIWHQGKDHFIISSLQSAQLERKLSLKMVKNRHPQALDSLFTLAPEQDNEDTRAWRVRAALLSNDWYRVDAALNRLTDEEQATSRWRYWKARTLSALRQPLSANLLYKQIADERDFYGFLAADRIKQGYSLNNHPIEVSSSSAQQLEQSWPFQAMKEFLAVDHELDARRLWWYKSQRLEHTELLAAARLAEQWGWHDVAIFTAARAKHWDDVELRFPLAYKEQVLKHAANAQLRPSLVYGVIRRESAFRANVSSRVGARGLMQIMPKTGRMLARKLNDRWRSAAQLFEPEINLRYGTTYLKQLSDRYNNNLVMVAAAYNAGPHRVERWRPISQSVPADIWVEAIPFNETRNYVQAVLAYMSIYNHRLGGEEFHIETVITDVQPANLSSEIINVAKQQKKS